MLKPISIAIASALFFIPVPPALADTPAPVAEPLATASEALARITASGYFAPFDLQFRHGLWTVEATTTEGRRVDVVLDPVSGAVWSNSGVDGHTFLSAAQVRTALAALGYTSIKDIEFDDGVWEAEARNARGQSVELIVHPVTGAVLAETPDGAGAPPTINSLTAAQIRAALTAAGYTQIRDLEFDDGFWEADARNPQGRSVELTIDPATGAVIREKND